VARGWSDDVTQLPVRGRGLRSKARPADLAIGSKAESLLDQLGIAGCAKAYAQTQS